MNAPLLDRCGVLIPYRVGATMKLILSRKGFDAKWGGCASPIFEDGSMLSLPIPDRQSCIPYRDIGGPDGNSIAPLVAQLTCGRIRARHGAHLDPDLRRESLRRESGWRPLFGQAGAAQAHLARNRVDVGDLFLFFGWFRRVDGAIKRTRFVPRAPNLHVIFGWMQVGEVMDLSEAAPSKMSWASYHPHLSARRDYTHNTLYVASERLGESGIPGAGVFPRLAPELCLTDLNPYLGRSSWRLPRWFAPRDRPALSRHRDTKRWCVDDDCTRLRTVPIGQEFVLDLDHYPEAHEWLRSLFSLARS